MINPATINNNTQGVMAGNQSWLENSNSGIFCSTKAGKATKSTN